MCVIKGDFAVFKTLAFLCCLCFVSQAQAQGVAGPADVSRINPLKEPQLLQRPSAPAMIPKSVSGTAVPDAAKGVLITLKGVDIEGATAFSAAELSDIYTPYINREITLDVLWVMADQL